MNHVRVDVAGCQIICAEVASDLERIDSMDLADDVLESRVESLIRRVAHFLEVHVPESFPFPWRMFDQDGTELVHS
jgi:hypothetical protein